MTKTQNTTAMTITFLRLFAFVVLQTAVCCAGLNDGLVGRWTFTGNANDSSGQGHHGTVNGATLTVDRFGGVSRAYSFDGTDDYIEIPDSADWKSQDFTISMWFKAERVPNIAVTTEAAGFLIAKGQNNYELSIGAYTNGATGMTFLPRNAIGNDWQTPDGVYGLGVWKHVVAVYKPSENERYVFIDGVQQSLTGPSNSPVGADSALSIWLGLRRDNTLAFKGSLDDARIYNRALSAAEAQQLYAAESVSPGSLDSLVADAAGGIVIGSAQQPDGKTILVGTFTSVNGVTRNNVARVNADGSLDMGFDPNPNGRVNAVAVLPDGKIVLGGFFTTVQGVARSYLARLNADGSLDASFDAQVDSFVYGLAAQTNGKLLLWGIFSSVLGTTRHNVARLNADGTLDMGFDPNPNDFVFGVAVQGDGKVLLGGGFTSLDPNAAGAPVARRCFARVGDDGSVDMGFDPSPNFRVFSTRQQPDGKVLLSGDFTALEPNGGALTTRNHIARVNANGTLDTGFNPDAPDFETNSVALQADGKVLFTGGFVTVQGTSRRYIARVGADGTLDANFDPNPDNFALSVTLQDDGKVQVGGGFASLQSNGAASPTPRVNFARLVNDPATQMLTAPDATQVLWQRGGSATEVTGVTFEKSNDGGATWTPSTAGTRVGTTANWQLTGFNLNGQVGKLRARGFTAGGYFNGSSGLIEQTSDFNFTPGITATPTLTAPAANSISKSPVTVTFTLPEAATSGSVKLKFVRPSDNFTRTLTLAASQETAGEHTFTFDPVNPLASGEIAAISPAASSIPDLTYDVTLSYQDADGNAESAATNASVKIDTLTQSPALLSFPQIGGTMGGPFSSGNAFTALLISLPEAAQPGSVTFTFDDGTTQYVFTTTSAIGAQGSNQIVFKPSNPVAQSYRSFPGTGNPIAFASGPSEVPQGGPYSISFTYQDLAGNAAVQSNVVTGVIVDTTTQPPTLTQPALNGIDNAAFDVSYTLPEVAFDGSAVLGFTGTNGTTGNYTLQLSSADSTQGAHSFQFDPRDPTASGHFVSGSAIPDGTYTVALSYSDAVFNPSANTSKSGVRVDTTPPAFTPAFSPTIVYAGTAIADYRSQAGASDLNGLFVGGLGAGQNPPVGTVLTAGTQHVTISHLDNAGNSASTSFDLIVRPITPASTALFLPGDVAPDAGVPGGPPADALLASFGVPAVDDDGHLAFTAKWNSATSGKGSGLFTELSCLAFVGSEVPGIDGATFKSFSDPVIHNSNVVCLATITGAVKGSVVIFGPATGPMTVLAQSGAAAPNADGATFKSFGGVGVFGGAIGFIGQLTPGSGTVKVTAANDIGLWLRDGAQPLDLMLREGQTPSGLKAIKTIVAFKSGNGSPGASRGWVREPVEGRMLALVVNADKTQDVLEAGPFGVGSLTTKSPDASGAAFASFGLPAANALNHVAFLGKLAVGGTVTKADAGGIFADLGDVTFTTIARVGSDAGATGADFSVLKDPVLSDDGGIAFPATIKGGTVKGSAAATLWWQPSGGSLALLAQGGAEPGDLPGAQWKSFPSLAIAKNRGPVFTATLVPGKGGVTKANASGVWACDFASAPRLLFRTGATDIVTGKTLKGFTLLNATKGSTGVARSYNAAQQVVWLATFTDKTQAIVTTEVP